MRATIAVLASLALPCLAAETKVNILSKEITQATTQAFNDDGTPRRAKREFRFKLRLVAPEGVRLARVSAVEVSDGAIDGGEKLSTRCSGGPEKFNEWEQERGDYDIDFTLPGASVAAKSLVRLAGTVTVQVVAGAAKQADLAPLKDHLGHPVRLEGVDDPISLDRKGGGFTVRGSAEFFDQLQKIELLDGKGKAIETRGWSGGSNNDEHYRTYQVQMPEDGSVRLTIAGSATETRVPFAFDNIPLEPVGKPAEAKVVKTTEVKPAKPAKPKGKDAPAEAPEPGGAKGF